MKIVLVGNGLHDKWHMIHKQNNSAFIDSCDLVIRENACTHYYRGYTGWKSDVLIMRSATETGTGDVISWEYDATVPEKVARDVKRIMVVGEPNDTVESASAPHCERYGWSMEQIEFLPYRHSELAREACSADPAYYMITLGTVALYVALEKWPDAEVHLSGYCFNYLDQQLRQVTHDVLAEYRWIKKLESEGRVSFVE